MLRLQQLKFNFSSINPFTIDKNPTPNLAMLQTHPYLNALGLPVKLFGVMIHVNACVYIYKYSQTLKRTGSLKY